MKRILSQPLQLLALCALVLALAGCQPQEPQGLVKTLEAFENAVAQAQPGQTITLANGTWNNAELVFKGMGTEEAPITLAAETPGQVIITGQSNLQLSGEHLVVTGLVFKNGYTPTSEVISFKTSKTQLANHCRVTECVIDNFSNPERFDGDTWVAMYGKNNRFDHNSLIQKRNQGVTMAVKLRTEESQENGHIIEYNYFGPRQVLGSNGGETLRIGTSHYSKTYSNTIVQNNYFDRTNGEHEIISNKSCGNEFRGNVFFESQGTLTMRHGHHTLVEGNYFLGNRKPNTGGIRIINEYQTVQHNYLHGLTGHRFRGALVIMNGVPNSPLNRYNQVVDSKMDANIVVDSDYIQLCAGSDEERSATPIGSSLSQNIIFTQSNTEPFTVYDDVSGISFQGNYLNEELSIPLEEGFSKVAYAVTQNEDGLWVPPAELVSEIGFGTIALPVQKEETGASYYAKPGADNLFGTGNTTTVAPGTNTLLEALEASQPGDVLSLEAGGEYLLTKYANIKHPVSLVGAEGAKARVLSEKSSFFIIDNGGALTLENLLIDGAESPDRAGNNVVSTSKYSMNHNYSLVVKGCEVKDLDKNHTFNFLKIYKNTFADMVLLENSTFTNITGAVLAMNQETEDLGIYNVENVVVNNCQFQDVQGAVLDIYRGGTDESTFGPIVSVTGSRFANTGHGKRNKTGASLKFHGVQKLHVNNSEWLDSAPLGLHLTNGEPITVISDCAMENTPRIVANNNEYTTTNIAYN